MAKEKTQGGFWSKSLFNSKIKSANTQASEIWLGYFGGPMLLFMAYYSVAGTYLTQFYTDVLGLAGGFLTLMPVISKVMFLYLVFCRCSSDRLSHWCSADVLLRCGEEDTADICRHYCPSPC